MRCSCFSQSQVFHFTSLHSQHVIAKKKTFYIQTTSFQFLFLFLFLILAQLKSLSSCLSLSLSLSLQKKRTHQKVQLQLQFSPSPFQPPLKSTSLSILSPPMPQLIRHLPHQKKVTLNTAIVCTAILTDLGKSNIAYGSGVVGFGAGTADVGEGHFRFGGLCGCGCD